MENNFIDPQTKEEFFFSSFRCKSNGAGAFYTDKMNRVLKNPTNGNTLVHIEKVKDFSTITFGKSNQKEVRAEMLAKRSKAHFKKEISESKYEKNKTIIKNFKNA